MNDKKRLIIETAIRLFSQKGYHATSIQEIVDTLGIAKGSVYFYFKSKEDLLLSACKYYIDMVTNTLQQESAEPGLSPRDRLAGLIVTQMEQLVKYRAFFKMIVSEQSLHLNDDFKKYLFGVRAHTLIRYSRIMTEIYGREAEKYALDVAAMFNAMVGQYTQFVLVDGKELDFHKLSRYLLDRLDDLVGGLMSRQAEPMLESGLMSDYMQTGGGGFERPEDSLASDIRSIRGIVERMRPEPDLLEEIMSSLLVLETELEKPEPQPVIVKGMIAYLKNLKIGAIRKHLAHVEASL